jgi:hypothetical protein
MRRIVKTGAFIGATAAVLIGGTLVSYASWILPDPAVTAHVKTPAMPSGPTPASKTAGAEVAVSWDAQQIVPGVKMTAYVVTAHDTDLTPLPSIARTVPASGSGMQSATFTAAELAGGKWKWAITPKLESWTGTEGALSNPKLIFPAAAPATAATAATAKALAPGTSNEAAQAAAPTIAPVELTPTPAVTTKAPAEKPVADPTTSAPEKTVEPEKTESPQAEPSPSVVDRSPSENAP